ncbi:hypothetical protein ARMGADRAFT_1090004 [Armillaria gallica]|uniref:Uncharacterized protein n=1 Tax=Armillaria gallica TaxID=47427 RepID=A0A2H3CIG7_ARMGA|nr:hypothetical protein ARMGADRAFT_1090004 [Armillaria gallica]
MSQPQPLLFLPTTFFEPEALSPISFPLNGVEGWESFPFHPPLTLQDDRFSLSEYSCRRLIQSTFSTLSTSKTDVGESVKNLNINPSTRLTAVTHTPNTILSRLREYTSGGISISDDLRQKFGVAMGSPMDPNARLSTFTFSGQSDGDSTTQTAQCWWKLPSAETQSLGIYGLSGWLKSMVYGPVDISVSSEDAVHDEVRRQLIEGLNKLLMTRYDLVKIEDQKKRGVFPQWGRPVLQAHASATSKHNKRPAGFPDFLLYHTDNPKNGNLPWEVKTFWSYPSNVVNEL